MTRAEPFAAIGRCARPLNREGKAHGLPSTFVENSVILCKPGNEGGLDLAHFTRVHMFNAHNHQPHTLGFLLVAQLSVIETAHMFNAHNHQPHTLGFLLVAQLSVIETAQSTKADPDVCRGEPSQGHRPMRSRRGGTGQDRTQIAAAARVVGCQAPPGRALKIPAALQQHSLPIRSH